VRCRRGVFGLRFRGGIVADFDSWGVLGLSVGLGEMRGKENMNGRQGRVEENIRFGGHGLGAGDRGVEFSLVGDGFGVRLADMVGDFLSKRKSKYSNVIVKY